MYIINVQFEWDDQKAQRNALKHGILFEEATTAFHDPEGLIAEDSAHSQQEQREWFIGESSENRLLVIVFTRRGQAIRLISARPAGRKERRLYEQSKRISF